MGYRIGRESSQVSEEGFGIAGFGGARCWGRSVSGWATPGVARTSVVRARGGGTAAVCATKNELSERTLYAHATKNLRCL